MAFTHDDLEEVERAIVALARTGQEVQYKDRRFRRAQLSELYELRNLMRRELGLVKRKRRQGILYNQL